MFDQRTAGSEDGAAVDYRSLFERVPGLYLVLTPDLHIVAVTDAYLQATMTERSQIVGRHLFEVFPDNPDDDQASGQQNLRASIDRVLATRTPDTMAVQKYDIRRPESDGGGFEERYWSPVNSPLLDDEGAVRYIVHRVQDVTDYVLLERAGTHHQRLAEHLRDRAARMEAEIVARSAELHQANEQLRAVATELSAANHDLERQARELRAADELKSQFVAMASHELRTPLTAIEGFTSTMLHRWDRLGEQEKLHFLGIIAAQTRRLSRLVEDVLKLSNVESGKLRVERTAVDVVAAVHEVLHDLDAADVELRAAAAPAIAVADPTHVAQILSNFLTNARKYGRPPYEVHVTNGGAWVEICVADHGDGVPEDFVPHLFQTFARAAPNQSSADGTGLGLAISRGLAHAQGGSVGHARNDPSGARFIVRLPAAPVAASPA